jgi:predicted amidohydrolase YtcJ
MKNCGPHVGRVSNLVQKGQLLASIDPGAVFERVNVALRGPEETPSRENALRYYTSGSAWFSHEEDQRGSLEVGKLADLAVLSKDYMTVPVDQVGGIESLLTMVDGRIVYAAGHFAGLDSNRVP